MLENAFLLTTKGLVLLGNATAFEAYPASKATATKGATVNPSTLESIITVFAPFASATCLIIEAYALALNDDKSFFTSTTFSAP